MNTPAAAGMPDRSRLVEEADRTIIQGLFDRTEQIVSSRGGAVEASAAQRRLCVLFNDGILLVERGSLRDPHVMAMREIASRKGVAVRAIYLTDLGIIRQMYEVRDGVSGQTAVEADRQPMEREVSALIAEAAARGASDLHIRVGRHEAEIMIRANGEMVRLRQIEASHAHALLAALYNGSDDADATYRLYDYQAARIASSSRVALPEGLQAVRLQFNPMGSGGRYLVARLLYADNHWAQRLTLGALGFHPAHLRALRRLRRIPEGVNIVSGPTGSGKSTTLKVLLEQLYEERQHQVNILTIEDPPEYQIHGAAQLPVTNVTSEEERGQAYGRAIVAALRSDPDVIMPGEARDAAVINLVFTAAMTGHQVWTSLHANSALAIFDRLRDQGVESYKLSDPSLITGLTAQRLVKRLCPHCSLPCTEEGLARRGQATGADFLHQVKRSAGTFISQMRRVNPAGCEGCKEGYAGRRVLGEVVCPDQRFLDLMLDGDRVAAEQHWIDALEGVPMGEHGWLGMVRGEIDPLDLFYKVGELPVLDQARIAWLMQDADPVQEVQHG